MSSEEVFCPNFARPNISPQATATVEIVGRYNGAYGAITVPHAHTNELRVWTAELLFDLLKGLSLSVKALYEQLSSEDLLNFLSSVGIHVATARSDAETGCTTIPFSFPKTLVIGNQSIPTAAELQKMKEDGPEPPSAVDRLEAAILHLEFLYEYSEKELEDQVRFKLSKLGHNPESNVTLDNLERELLFEYYPRILYKRRPKWCFDEADLALLYKMSVTDLECLLDSRQDILNMMTRLSPAELYPFGTAQIALLCEKLASKAGISQEVIDSFTLYRSWMSPIRPLGSGEHDLPKLIRKVCIDGVTSTIQHFANQQTFFVQAPRVYDVEVVGEDKISLNGHILTLSADVVLSRNRNGTLVPGDKPGTVKCYINQHSTVTIEWICEQLESILFYGKKATLQQVGSYINVYYESAETCQTMVAFTRRLTVITANGNPMTLSSDICIDKSKARTREFAPSNSYSRPPRSPHPPRPSQPSPQGKWRANSGPRS